MQPVTFPSGNGIPLKFFKGAKAGRPKIGWRPLRLRGAQSWRALAVTGPSLKDSNGVLSEQNKHFIGDLWIETSNYEELLEVTIYLH